MNGIFPFLFSLFVLLNCPANSLAIRSIWRPSTMHTPRIEAHWQDKKNKTFVLHNPCLRATIFNIFDPEYLDSNLLNHHTTITPRNSRQSSMSTKDLDDLINNLVDEIRAGKKRYTNFRILKGRDYNRRLKSGSLILASNDYDIVVKLFLETPHGLMHPFSKGFEPACMFLMNGGISRHLAGFTRIKNRHLISNLLEDCPEWNKRIIIPRKWYWLPKKSRSITITGHNMGSKEPLSMTIPSTYAIVCDAINVDRSLSHFNKKDRDIGLELFNMLENKLDPKIMNFMYEKETGNIALVDTEDFPVLIGLRHKKCPKRYTGWYLSIGNKYLKDCLFTDKKKRLKLQQIALLH